MNYRLSLLTIALLASGCATAPGKVAVPPSPDFELNSFSASKVVQPPAQMTPTPAEQRLVGAAPVASKSKLLPGTDQVIKPGLVAKTDPVLTSGDKVTLNFESVPVGNLAHVLLGDVLQLNYSVDAGSDVVVSLRTRQPLDRTQVLDVLDTVLLPHDLAIVRDQVGVYHVTKRAATVGTRPVVGAAHLKDLAGAGTVIAPLNYIAAGEMAKILAPVAPKDAVVYVDTLRNLLILQGSKAQLGGWLDLIEAFDIDYLSGMSLGVFVLENANVNEVREALQTLLSADKSADQAASARPAANPAGGAASAAGASAGSAGGNASPFGGLFRVFPVERLNALVVVTPRKHLLNQVENWVRQLDRPSDGLEPSLYVYPIQNGSAVNLADMINALFSNDTNRATTGVAAGAAPTQFARTPATTTGTPTNTATASAGGAGGASALQALNSATSANAASAQSAPVVSRLDNNVRVVADPKRNALIIRAPKQEYRRIEQALRELDKAPTQVLIEASIVEVSLVGNLKYGVDWALQNGLTGGRIGNAVLNMNQSGTIGPSQPGFSYTILNKAGVVRAAINALAEQSQVKVLSNPSVLVLSNHNATIQIGNQQPIKASTTVSSNSVVTESITYKDTGVMLTVTPSVNSGGLITMDIGQQVTDVGEIDAATGQRNFLSRQMQSRVAVRSGESIVLGGLIRENQTQGTSGVPLLSSMPVFGALFSTNSNNSNRTELLVLLTPRALEDDDQLRAAGAELRQRMQSLSMQRAPALNRLQEEPAR